MAERERNELGQWLPGVSGNKGRSYRADTLKALRKVVTKEDWEAIAKKAVAQAKDGNPAARNWLSEYLLGEPPEEQISATPFPVSLAEWQELVEKRREEALNANSHGSS